MKLDCQIDVKIRKLPHADGIDPPTYMSEGSSGMDIRAAVEKPVVLQPLERMLIPTGFILSIPQGYEAQIRPRSGLAIRNGISLLNSPGTIDSDFRGEVNIILANLGSEPFVVERGMRIAQMVIAPVTKCNLSVYDKLDETVRSAGGFGHTGL